MGVFLIEERLAASDSQWWTSGSKPFYDKKSAEAHVLFLWNHPGGGEFEYRVVEYVPKSD